MLYTLCVEPADWAIVRFNTDIQDCPSWEAFATAILAQVAPGTLGTCYEYSGGTVQVTREPLPREDKGTVWQKTTGNGWQQVQQDRTVIEYRVNTKAGLLLRIEGVNPWFSSRTLGSWAKCPWVPYAPSARLVIGCDGCPACIGVLQVWQKQGGTWTLLARQSVRTP